MDNRYNLLKLLVCLVNIFYLLFCGTSYYALHKGLWWKYLIGALIIFMILLKWVSFMRKNENLWAFVITFLVMLPCVIRFSYNVVNEYFCYMNLLSRVLYGIVLCMSLISVAEILTGVLTRIIWRRQDDVICIEKQHQY